MERLQCKACGSMSMTPLEVEPEIDTEADDAAFAPSSGGQEEARFYTCHVCGDNWLSVRRVEPDGVCRLTFVHQMGLQPTLKRVAELSTPIIVSDQTVGHWDYFLGDDAVAEEEWRESLDERRMLLRSICTN